MYIELEGKCLYFLKIINLISYITQHRVTSSCNKDRVRNL